MARKSNTWQDDAPAMQSPFGALAQLKKNDGAEAAPAKTEPEAAQATAVVLPKVKSSRIERAQRGGKTVTVVVFHGEPTTDAMRAWLKMAKTKLGVGGAVEDGQVILQGDQRERLCSISEK